MTLDIIKARSFKKGLLCFLITMALFFYKNNLDNNGIDIQMANNNFATIMVFKSRLVNFFFNRSEQNIENILLYNKSKWSLDKFTRVLSLLLVGFLVGNLFGTFLNTIRKYIRWDGAIVFFLVIVIEISSYKIYHNKDRIFFPFIITGRGKVMRCVAKTQLMHSVALPKLRFGTQRDNTVFAQPTFGKVRIQSKIIKPLFWKYFNFFKIGLMVGFFVDAFKVGS